MTVDRESWLNSSSNRILKRTSGWVWQQQFRDDVDYVLKPWQGGILIYTEDKLDQIKDSLVKFQEKDDTKAAILVGFAYTSGQVWSSVAVWPLVWTDATDATDHNYYLSFLWCTHSSCGCIRWFLGDTTCRGECVYSVILRLRPQSEFCEPVYQHSVSSNTWLCGWKGDWHDT